jgi:tetratricopeptide (TPR) repeat protein
MWFQHNKLDLKSEAQLEADTAVYKTMRQISKMLEANEEEAKVREQLQLALEQHPQSGWGHFMAGIVLKKFGRQDEALQLLGLAIALEPDHPAYYRYMATILQGQGKHKQAEGVLANGLGHYAKLFRRKLTEQERKKYCQVMK